MSLKYEVVHVKNTSDWHPALKFFRHGVRYRKNGPVIMWYDLSKKQGYYKYESKI